jgi:vacuolar-type H+-ATPase subunit H
MAEITDSVTSGSSDEIRADIERTRAEMDSTFDALDQKLTPSQLLAEAWRYTKGGSSIGAGKLWSLARQHPLPATMIGVGLGWLLVERSRSKDDSRYDYDAYGYTGEGASGYGRYGRYGSSNNVDVDYRSSYFDEDVETGRLASAAGAVKDAAGNAVDTVKDAAGNAIDTVKDAASTAREKVHGLTDTVKERASGLSDTAHEKATQLRNKAKYQTRKAKTGFWQMMEENPLAVGAAVLTLGAIAGFSLPSTDKEDELLGETRDHLLDKAKETGQEVLEKGKHVAESAVETLKHEAEAQGLTAENLVDKVKTVGREAKNAVVDEAKKQNLTPESLNANANAGDTTNKPAENKPADNKQAQNKPVENKPAEQLEPELARR